ncbi:hypothetical protein [Cellulomonas aerilata]|uniref:hypothetical protein n=1 Tax=Cellulomonas aerilata TaxID=515326 RepID=UPI0011BE9839|nr:hypothetical protein [Cellulomonas aerilata]
MTGAFAMFLAAAPAVAQPTGGLESRLAELWSSVLETPGGAAQNPVLEGDPCVDLRGRTVAPFGGLREELTCTVEEGTKIFVAAWSSECSTFEAGTDYFGADKADLRACAARIDAGVTVEATLDGAPLPLTEVTTRPLRIGLPAANVFGLTGDARRGLAVGHGWVATVRGLQPGTHEIVIHSRGEYLDAPLDLHSTTTIVVRPRHT